MDYLATHTSLSPIQRMFVPGFVNYKNGCTRLTATSDKVNQLLAYGRWFSPGTPASSTTKTGRHDIAEILLKVALKHHKLNQNQLIREIAKTGCLETRIMCPSGATCLPADCCLCELAIWKSNSVCWSSTKRTPSSSHWKLTCSRHDIADKLVNWR